MTIKRFSRALGIAAGLAIMTLSPSFAAAQQSTGNPQNEQVQGERAQPGRIAGSRASQRRQRPQPAPAAPDPAVIKAEVEAVLAAASVTCQVTDSKFMGSTAEQVKLYETACATGPGYILVASTPPQAVDCVVLHNQAEAARTRDPAATPQVCTLPGNQDVMGVMKAYAAEAGVACTVDEMAVRGQTSGGVVVYEVGCSGVDGYWIQKNADGWQTTECLQILQQSSTCAFTTPAEQAASVKSWLAGSAAAGCDVQQVRLMGQNPNGRFYEAACAAGDGFIARTNAEHVVQQVYPCAEASLIGGGCKLTTTPPAATPAA